MTLYFAGNELDAFTAFNGTVTADANVALSGINRSGLRLDSWNQSADLTLPTPLTEFWFHIRLYKFGFDSASSGNNFLLLRNAEGQSILTFNGNRNSSTITGTSGTTFTFPLTTSNIDVQLKISATVGYLRVWQDQILIFERTGNVQFASGTQSVANLQLWGISINTGYGIMFSQVVFSSNPTLNAKVYSVPLSTASLNEWTGTIANIQGTGFAALVDGLKENTADQSFLCAAGDIPVLTGTEFIEAVAVHTSALFEAASPVTKVAPLVNDGSTTIEGSSHTLTNTFAQKTWVYDTNPHTSTAWTRTAVNAMSIGLRAKA